MLNLRLMMQVRNSIRLMSESIVLVRKQILFIKNSILLR